MQSCREQRKVLSLIRDQSALDPSSYFSGACHDPMFMFSVEAEIRAGAQQCHMSSRYLTCAMNKCACAIVDIRFLPGTRIEASPPFPQLDALVGLPHLFQDLVLVLSEQHRLRCHCDSAGLYYPRAISALSQSVEEALFSYSANLYHESSQCLPWDL